MKSQRSIWSVFLIVLSFFLSVALAICGRQLHQSNERSRKFQANVNSLEVETLKATSKILELVDDSREMQEIIVKLQNEAATLEKVERARITADMFAFRGLELMKLKRFRDAAASFEIMILAHPRNLVFHDKLIECYIEIGDERQVKAYRQKQSRLLDEFKNGNWLHRSEPS